MARKSQVKEVPVRELIKPRLPDKFFCYIHLEDLPLEKQSPDPRYCQFCYNNLLEEAAVLGIVGAWNRPGWIPEVKTKPQPTPQTATTKSQSDKTAVPKLFEYQNKDAKHSEAKKPTFGTKLGRPKTKVDEKELVAMSRDMTLREISEKTKIPRSTLGRIIKGQKAMVL